MITVTDLTKRYARHTAVDHISFEVHKGQIVGFLGPNGAGKTTTMRMLTCFLSPTSGTATVAGFDVLEQSFEVKERIGYLPESAPVGVPAVCRQREAPFQDPACQAHRLCLRTVRDFRCQGQAARETFQGLSPARWSRPSYHSQS